MAPKTRNSTGGTKWADKPKEYDSDEIDDSHDEETDDEEEDEDEYEDEEESGEDDSEMGHAVAPASGPPTPQSRWAKLRASANSAKLVSKLSSVRNSTSTNPEERRIDTDGGAYTKEEFEQEYGTDWESYWDEALPADGLPKAVATPIVPGSKQSEGLPMGFSSYTSGSEDTEMMKVRSRKMPFLAKAGYGLCGIGWRATQAGAYVGAGFAAATGMLVGGLAYGVGAASGSLNGRDKNKDNNHSPPSQKNKRSAHGDAPPPPHSMSRSTPSHSHRKSSAYDDFAGEARAGARVPDTAAAFHERGHESRSRRSDRESGKEWLSRRDDRY